MRVSVITVSYNSERTIEETIRSVASQTEADLDYIVSDGQSTDGTNKIVDGWKNSSVNLRHFVEPDLGIYDAMNKAVLRASGDVIGFLNSDDYFAECDVLKDIQTTFQTKSVDIIYGDIDIFQDDSNRKILRAWRSGDYSIQSLKYGWHPPHPTFYMRKDLFMKLGGFDLSVGLAADYDLMVRALMSPNCKVAYLNRVLVKMRKGGASTSGLKPVLQGWLSSQIPWRKMNMPIVGLCAATLKPLRKLMQLRV